ncbi:hypothetical protein JTE90_000314 [Oedothorax gibbosus]|uniref:BTB domain-containing protein n=1 Tax=Oedothorax gibbosus TaxID=931172 RepID=A0AAV6VRZ4_9ARAC|nr:hypothetical protein JTE90_000314 [Oedothorax gibbosus]
MVVEGPESFTNERWQKNVRSLKGGLAYICQTSALSDITMLVGSKKFKGHKLILKIRSEKFSKMFNKEEGNRATMEEIRITDVGEQAFEILFNYIYTSKIGDLDVNSRELVLEVHRAASVYGQHGLREACEAIIDKWEISHETVISVLQMSDVQIVIDRCWKHLQLYAREVLASNGILEATDDTLCEIFERGYFNGVPVMELLTHIVRWASRLFPCQPDFERVREHLLVCNGAQQRCLMSWIGLQKLSLEQLGMVMNKYPKLINDSEFRMFFLYVTAPEDKKPALPSWIEG